MTKSSKINSGGRRSIYVSKKIKKGDSLTKENIKIVRPSYSLHPKYYEKILDYKAKKNLDIGDRITFKNIKKNKVF